MSAVRYLFDEDFNGRIVRGSRRRRPGANAVRVHDVGLTNVDAAQVLEWAARHRRVVISHDRRTMTHGTRNFLSYAKIVTAGDKTRMH